ncbi:hypothetical protein TWF788_007718 [Orbilia oligospora]|nr:hypothetical protein TWF788_007718 [Orbilia oligospora]KAF3243869.1 hypothetical protein TWF192_007936 [Orbilia oligospora]
MDADYDVTRLIFKPRHAQADNVDRIQLPLEIQKPWANRGNGALGDMGRDENSTDPFVTQSRSLTVQSYGTMDQVPYAELLVYPAGFINPMDSANTNRKDCALAIFHNILIVWI